MTGSPIMLPEVMKKGDGQIASYLTNVECLKRLDKTIPVMGICFGCQLMNILNGGTLENVGGDTVLCQQFPIKPTSTKTRKGITASPCKAKFCCKYMPHKVSSDFKTIMTVDLNGKTYPCMIKHKKFPLWGCMFHPEALKRTHIFLDEFLDVCGRKKSI
jgi:anthranilate/para-aminobenzoate synthase component II